MLYALRQHSSRFVSLQHFAERTAKMKSIFRFQQVFVSCSVSLCMCVCVGAFWCNIFRSARVCVCVILGTLQSWSVSIFRCDSFSALRLINGSKRNNNSISVSYILFLSLFSFFLSSYSLSLFHSVYVFVCVLAALQLCLSTTYCA